MRRDGDDPIGGDIVPFCDSRLAARAMRLFAALTSERDLAETTRLAGLPADLTDREPLSLPYARCALWMELAARRLGERHFGALVGCLLRYGDQGPYGAYVLEAPTLLRALARGRRALPLIANAARLATRVETGHLVLQFEPGLRRVIGARHVDEHFPMLVTDLVRSYCGPDWRPGWIELPWDEASRETALIDHYGGCEVRPSGAAGIAIPIADLRASNPMPAPTLDALTLRDLPALLQARAPACFEDAARYAIRICLRRGDLSAETVAALLDTGVRTLQRRLNLEGLSFRDIRLDETLSRGLALVRESDASIKDIALALGYDEPRSFRRAFRARFGQAPSEVRGGAEAAAQAAIAATGRANGQL
jgi:AraC-like DNA-binding protein